MKHRFLCLLLVGVLILGCRVPVPSVGASDPIAMQANPEGIEARTLELTASAVETPSASAIPAPTAPPTPTDTPTFAPTDEPTPVPTETPTRDPNRPMVALTFDDGPNREFTPQVLDLLERYGAKATFFVVGANLSESTKPILQRMVDMGCDVGMHGLTHTDMRKFSIASNTKRFERMRGLISDQIAGGYETHLLRPPYGAINDKVKKACKAAEVASIRWSVDTMDWSNKNPKKILKIVKQETENGAIILFHDRLATTVEALEPVLLWLVEQGYELVTVTELLESAAPIEYGRDYRYKKIP